MALCRRCHRFCGPLWFTFVHCFTLNTWWWSPTWNDCFCCQPHKQLNGNHSVPSSRFSSSSSSSSAWNRHPVTSESPLSKWAAAASVSDARRTDIRSAFQKDRVGLPSKFPAQKTHSFDPADPRHAWIVQPSRKFDDTDEEAQSPMVTSHNGTSRGFLGIPPVMTSSICSTNGDELSIRSSGIVILYMLNFVHQSELVNNEIRNK